MAREKRDPLRREAILGTVVGVVSLRREEAHISSQRCTKEERGALPTDPTSGRTMESSLARFQATVHTHMCVCVCCLSPTGQCESRRDVQEKQDEKK